MEALYMHNLIEYLKHHFGNNKYLMSKLKQAQGG